LGDRRWPYAWMGHRAARANRAGVLLQEPVNEQHDGRAPVLVPPAFGRGCVTDLMPYLLGAPGAGGSLPVELPTRGARVLLVLDGVGWDQLQARPHLVPTLMSMSGGPITTVAPSTTATALTSITTGLSPAEHGIVGYRMLVDDQVLNCLRWGTELSPDVRATIPPSMLQPYPPFMGQPVPLVTKEEFRRSGFSEAHLRGCPMVGYRTTAVLVHHAARLIREGERLVYTYYDGVDKVAHEYGLGPPYDAELAFVDRLVADLLAAVPAGTTVLVTADHGQVDCGRSLLPLASEVSGHMVRSSGEARFRWLHARQGHEADLLAAAETCHGSVAWIRSLEQMLDEGLFGVGMDREVRARLGDVALLPFEPTGFDDPSDTGPFELIGRHGSLTSAEMLVPCLVATV
jgi:Type I phosphodiesterase / nucleotide pyrophosphatase